MLIQPELHSWNTEAGSSTLQEQTDAKRQGLRKRASKDLFPTSMYQIQVLDIEQVGSGSCNLSWIGSPFLEYNLIHYLSIQNQNQQYVVLFILSYKIWISMWCRLNLGWPIAPSYMSPNAGGRGEVTGCQPISTTVHMEPKKLQRSKSIFKLCPDPSLPTCVSFLQF